MIRYVILGESNSNAYLQKASVQQIVFQTSNYVFFTERAVLLAIKSSVWSIYAISKLFGMLKTLMLTRDIGMNSVFSGLFTSRLIQVEVNW